MAVGAILYYQGDTGTGGLLILLGCMFLLLWSKAVRKFVRG